MRVATYDIINAGPKNRFRADGKIVSNSGKVFQPQNLPSRGLLEDYEIDFGIHALKAGEANFFYPNIMKLLSSCVRGVLIASPGKMLAVADLSNIEGRFAAWVSGELWKIQAFKDFDEGTGHDLYNLAYSRAFKIPVEEVKKHQRAIGKVMELMLQYQGSNGAFVTGAMGYGFDLEKLAKDNWDTLPEDILKEANSFYGFVIKKKIPTYGLSKNAYIAVNTLVRLWRESNPNIASMWTRLEEAIRSAISNPKEVFEVGEFIKVLRNKNWLRIRLPSGRSLCYANPRLDERGEISYMGLNNYTRQWQRIKGYGGLFLENCLAGDSRVVTNTGVKYLIDVTSSDKVWDGVEFVGHSGVMLQGLKELVSVNGIRMTPDHKILTEEGWKIASSCEGLNRYESGLPDGYPVPTGRTQEHMVDPLCVRKRDRDGRERIPETDEEAESILRLQVQGIYRGNNVNPQDVGTPGILGLALYARQVQIAYTSSVEKLWSAWHSCLRFLEFVSEFLERHGADLGERHGTRTKGQRQGVFSRELCLANLSAPSEQPSEQQASGHSIRPNESKRSRTTIRGEEIDIRLSISSRLAVTESVGPVYDLMNCGPRNRFVVLDENDVPMIVHNCCQAGSRDILYGSMPRAEAAGFEIVLHVHDELVTEFDPRTELTLENLCEILSAPVQWAPGLPLSAAGFVSDRYKK